MRTGVASENSIHLTRSQRRIRTRLPNDCNRPLVHRYAARLLQAATAAGSRNPDTAASAQCSAAAHAAPSTEFALDRPRPVYLALSSLSPHSGCNEHRQARDCRALASQGFGPLLCEGDPLRTMYFETVDWATAKPSISSSPWIRDAPHLGLSLLIRRMR